MQKKKFISNFGIHIGRENHVNAICCNMIAIKSCCINVEYQWPPVTKRWAPFVRTMVNAIVVNVNAIMDCTADTVSARCVLGKI